MFAPFLVLLVVLIDATADMVTTSIALGMGIPERNRFPRWFFKKLGRVRGPIIYLPLEVLIVYGALSIAYNMLLISWGQEIAGSIVFYIAIILAASVIFNNATRLLLKWRNIRKALGPIYSHDPG